MWMTWPKVQPRDTRDPAGSFSYLWRWGLYQVPAFLDRVSLRVVLTQNGAGL